MVDLLPGKRHMSLHIGFDYRAWMVMNIKIEQPYAGLGLVLARFLYRGRSPQVG